ncbi:MAG: hypothetical protein QOE61_410 [Micromonosporaceae bacterium]|nr:hypothetical protein [Micromonosporaceae bacterium]
MKARKVTGSMCTAALVRMILCGRPRRCLRAARLTVRFSETALNRHRLGGRSNAPRLPDPAALRADPRRCVLALGGQPRDFRQIRSFRRRCHPHGYPQIGLGGRRRDHTLGTPTAVDTVSYSIEAGLMAVTMDTDVYVLDKHQLAVTGAVLVRALAEGHTLTPDMLATLLRPDT